MAATRRNIYGIGFNTSSNTTIGTGAPTGTDYPQVGDYVVVMTTFDNQSGTTPTATAMSMSGGGGAVDAFTILNEGTSNVATALGSVRVAIGYAQVTTAYTSGPTANVTLSVATPIRTIGWTAVTGAANPAAYFSGSSGFTGAFSQAMVSAPKTIGIMNVGTEANAAPSITSGTVVASVGSSGGGSAANVFMSIVEVSGTCAGTISDGGIIGITFEDASTSTPVSGAETGTFSASTETSSLAQSNFTTTDAGTFSVTGTAAIASTSSTTDSGTFSATETSALSVVLSGTDTGTFSATETSSLPASWSIVTENAISTDIYNQTYYLDYATESISTFARSTYYTRGQTAQFSTNYGSAYQIKIYRLGYYGGPGGHLVATIAGTPTTQPSPTVIPNSNGAVTCSAWSVTDQWAIPANATPGWYWASFVDSVNSNAAGVPFVVSDADQKAPVVVVSSEATWHGAYNGFGGNNLYGASLGVGAITDRALCVTYDKPVITRDYVPQTHFVNGELAMLRFMERMGFEIGYTTNEQIDADPTILDGRTHIIFSGHNEYVSQRVRDKVANRIANGVRICNFAGNDFFWRTAYGNESGFTHGSHLGRVMWCKKDTMGGPSTHVAGQPFTTQADWMGTWQDTRWTSAAGTTELFGDRFIANGIRSDEVKVPFDYRTYPIWRNCSGIQSLTTGGVFSFGGGTAGMEWDKPESSTLQYVKLSKSTVNLDGSVSDINGQFYNGNGTYDHAFQLAKSGSAYIFNANTTQWAWALDDLHPDRGSAISTNEGRQSTLNIFYDLGMSGNSSMISTAGLTVPTPVSSIDVSYGLSGDVNPTASDTGTVSVTESSSLLVIVGGGGGGGSTTQHSIFGATAPSGATLYTDGGANIILGDAFYRTTSATNGWRVIGAKIYVPAGSSETSLTVSLYATTYQTTSFNITSPGTPIQTKTITPVANQWNNVYFDAAYDLPDRSATNGVAWITYTFGNGHYVAAGGGTTTTVQASDGSTIWVAENLVGPGSLGQAPQFTIDGGAASANSTANYGIDIIIDEGAASGSSSVADSGTFSATESAAVSVVLSGTDTGTFSITETSASSSTPSRTDTGTFSATDASASTITSPTSDSGTLSATETSALLVTLARTDTGTFSATETASTVIVATLSATDTGTFSTTETSAIQIVNAISTTDAGTFSAGTETSSSQSTLSRTDVGTFSASGETSASQSTLSRTDTGTLSATDTSASAGTLSRTDTGTFSASGQVAAVGILILKTANDTGTFSVTSTAVAGDALHTRVSAWNGTTMKAVQNVRYWNGTTFKNIIVHRWNGTTFV